MVVCSVSDFWTASCGGERESAIGHSSLWCVPFYRVFFFPSLSLSLLPIVVPRPVFFPKAHYFYGAKWDSSLPPSLSLSSSVFPPTHQCFLHPDRFLFLLVPFNSVCCWPRVARQGGSFLFFTVVLSHTVWAVKSVIDWSCP